MAIQESLSDHGFPGNIAYANEYCLRISSETLREPLGG